MAIIPAHIMRSVGGTLDEIKAVVDDSGGRRRRLRPPRRRRCCCCCCRPKLVRLWKKKNGELISRLASLEVI